MKSGCIDFLDFVDKLASRVTNSDQQILRSNHVTWLLAQIIRIEIVMNTLSSDPRKVMHIYLTLFKFYCFCNSMQLII
jgi:mediator of RNA polymerase II transcription subunit 23